MLYRPMTTGATRLTTSWLVPLVVSTAPSLALCCNGGSAARPEVDAGVMSPAHGEASLDGGSSFVTVTPPDAPIIYGVCDDAAVPTFASLYGGVFATASCGTGKPYDCHSSTGALPISEGGTGSLLDFSLDASSVFAELLGDGSGVVATNARGTDRTIFRIAPGNADASLLYIKLVMPTASDPRYGLAMPPTSLVCPGTLEAVRAWIADGALPQ
jgi:hypothetical protein